jgi:hypothetical protein
VHRTVATESPGMPPLGAQHHKHCKSELPAWPRRNSGASFTPTRGIMAVFLPVEHWESTSCSLRVRGAALQFTKCNNPPVTPRRHPDIHPPPLHFLARARRTPRIFRSGQGGWGACMLVRTVRSGRGVLALIHIYSIVYRISAGISSWLACNSPPVKAVF